MRKRTLSLILCVSALLFSAPVILAAEEKGPLTQFEEISSQNGTLLIKDIYKIGRIAGTNFESLNLSVVVLYSPGGDKYYAMRLEKPSTDKYTSTAMGVLDYNELKSVIESVSYMIETAAQFKQTERAYTEVSYKTKGNVEVGFYQSGRSQGAWVQVNSYSSNRTLYIDVAKFPEFLKLLQQGKEKLQGLGAN